MTPTESLPPAAATGNLPHNVKVLGWASLMNDMAGEIIFPLLPQFILTLSGGNRFYVGLIEGLADSVASLLKLWSGAWSDRMARRSGLVIGGYLLAALLRPGLGLVTAVWQVLIPRVGDRIGKGLRTSARDAMIADATPPASRGRAFGFHRAMDHLGAAIGPILATVFLIYWPGELRTLFLLTIIPGLAVAVILIFGLREETVDRKPVERFQWTLAPLGQNFRWYLLTLLVFTLGNSSDAFLLVRAGELGVPTAWLPILWCVFHIAKSAGNTFVGRLVDRVGPRKPLIAGWIVYAAVYLAFGIATEAWQAWALFLGYAIYYSLAEPAEKTLVTQLVGPERKGLAFGWFNFSIGIATLPASVAFGLIYQYGGALAAFGWGAALALLAVVMLAGVKQGEPAK